MRCLRAALLSPPLLTVALAATVSLFNLSFWSCGLLCMSNLFVRSNPYHIFATDLLTAYVHLQAWQGWLTFRIFVNSEACDNILNSVMTNEDTAAIVRKVLPIAGVVILLLQARA